MEGGWFCDRSEFEVEEEKGNGYFVFTFLVRVKDVVISKNTFGGRCFAILGIVGCFWVLLVFFCRWCERLNRAFYLLVSMFLIKR